MDVLRDAVQVLSGIEIRTAERENNFRRVYQIIRKYLKVDQSSYEFGLQSNMVFLNLLMNWINGIESAGNALNNDIYIISYEMLRSRFTPQHLAHHPRSHPLCDQSMKDHMAWWNIDVQCMESPDGIGLIRFLDTTNRNQLTEICRIEVIDLLDVFGPTNSIIPASSQVA